MNIPNMFKKVAGAVATSVILAGAPGAANAGMERVGEATISSPELNTITKSHEDNFNKKLTSLNLPNITIPHLGNIPGGNKIKFSVFLKEPSPETGRFDLILENEESDLDTVKNKYKFEEKFMSTIIEQVKLKSEMIKKNK